MKVFLDMVGCRLNQSEIETFARQFRLAGHSLVSEAGSADLVVINTCTVTAAAASDSRQKVRQAARAGVGKIVVTGCHATLNPAEIAGLPGYIQVIGNPDKDNLVPIVLDLPSSGFDQAYLLRQPIPGVRLRTRAFIKVQDGCDNHCTYCITRLARGAGRSRPTGEIILEIQSALEAGCKEIVLTGVHLGSWGCDFHQPSQLHNLVREILDDTLTPRLHLSSIEPWDIHPEFFDLWQDARICRHLHLPLQSGCLATLKRMGRNGIPDSYAHMVHRARQVIPGVSITTDIISGFPGESEDEFAESLSFIQEMNFAGGHVFTYSPRPGTAAVKLPGQVNPRVAKHRNAIMRQIFEQSALAYRQQNIGRVLPVLWEKASPINDHQWQLSGLSDNYLRVHAVFSAPCQNEIMNVRMIGIRQDGLVGEILLT